jgi:predicted nuclease of predicted toxin-antitoxin system
LRFLLDVNVGSTIAAALESAGHDVVRTAFLAPRALDPQILAWVVSEQRVLISYDSDFTDLIFRDQAPPPPAVIYIRDEPIDLQTLSARIVALVGSDFLLDHIHVIGEIELRHRKFPGR